MATIIVSGALANRYLNAGGAWVRLSWVRGLQKMGFDVLFVEQIGRDACVDAGGRTTAFGESVNLGYFKQVVEEFGLEDSAALIYERGEEIFGLSLMQLVEAAAAADLLVNISGHLTWERLVRSVRRRAYVDLDPGFTQFWAAEGRALRLEDHDLHFTIGENIGRPSCPIPTGNIDWRPTRQPVVMTDWPVTARQAPFGFTTVGTLRGPFGPVQHGGTTYGLKVHELRKFVSLPRLVDQPFELAFDIHEGDDRDRQLLEGHGWRLVDPRRAAPDPAAFRRYVQRSGAEFSVAQGMYVDTAGGWFSDRTVRYLASGRPALVQDTGFSRNLPVGEGMMAFRTLDEAVAGADRIAADYDAHCIAARALAETYFDSDRVLGRFIDEAGIQP